jgi:hypothetical protein
VSAAFHLFSYLLADVLDSIQISELTFGFTAGSGWLPTPGDQVIRLGLDVKTKLVSYICRRIGAEEPCVAPPDRDRFHAGSSGNGICVALRILATALA